jgi:predicted DNA-binding ribbon-helix-helix protein
MKSCEGGDSPVAEYKRFIQSQLDKVKSTANDLISSKHEQTAATIELEPEAYEALHQIAERQQTSVQSLANHIIDQHLSSLSALSGQIPVEKKEENPMLYLDAMCKIQG